MDAIIPWEAWVEIIRPHYPSGKRGRPVRGIETMLRMYLLQIWFNLSDAGVDAGTGFVHTITGTAANVHDSQQISELIRNDDEVVYGDSGYLGAAEQEAIKSNENFSKIEFRINKRPSSLKIKDYYEGENWDKRIEQSKSSVRSKVAHPHLIVKRYFGYWKVAYKGIAKNMNRFHILFACANLVMCIRANRSLAPIAG